MKKLKSKPEIECPNCKEGLVVEINGKLFCEDCTKEVMEIKIIEIFRYYEGDEVPDCGGDYDEVDVVINGENVISYGDYYHDKGDVAADAFVAGYLHALNKKCKVKYIREAQPFDE